MAIQTYNPTTDTVLQTYDALTKEELEQKLATADVAYTKWRLTSYAKRSQCLNAAAAHLRSHLDEYAGLVVTEMGKPIKAARGEIEKCAKVCEYYATHGPQFLSHDTRPTDAKEAFVRYDPIGPVLAVMPWNFPFWQVMRFAAPALMAGNVGLLKHASNVPQCALAIEETFRAAGVPAGGFTTLLIDSKTVAAVIEDPRVAAVTLTGSEAAGASVAATAASVIKKSVLELGGSDPFIVRADAKVETVAAQAATARFQNCGQSCIAAKRFIVHESIATEFTKAFVAATEALVLGDPADEKTDIGPMVDMNAREMILKQIETTVAAGGVLETGGTIPDRAGAFITPAIVSGVTAGMPLYEEETFSPAAAVITVKDDEEATAVANDTPFGLGASIWTADLEAAKAMAAAIDSGSVFINTIVVSDINVPFGGVKRSGYGRELSEEGIKEFVNVKTVKVNPAG